MMRALIRFVAGKPAVRFGVAGAALALGLGAGALQAGSAVDGHNTDAPVDYAADHIDLLGKQDRVVLSGNVDIRQDDLRMKAARATVAYVMEGDKPKIQRLDAVGDVYVTRGNENAHGDVAIYDFNAKIITMVGNVVVHRGDDVLTGPRLVIDLNGKAASIASGRSEGGARVSGRFTPVGH